MYRKNKLYCDNCGTLIKGDEKSCPVCHMTIEREENDILEEETEKPLKNKFPIGRVIMIIVIITGIVLTIKGVVEYQNIEYCTAENCGLQELFVAGLGIILILSASVALAKDSSK